MPHSLGRAWILWLVALCCARRRGRYVRDNDVIKKVSGMNHTSLVILNPPLLQP